MMFALWLLGKKQRRTLPTQQSRQEGEQYQNGKLNRCGVTLAERCAIQMGENLAHKNFEESRKGPHCGRGYWEKEKCSSRHELQKEHV